MTGQVYLILETFGFLSSASGHICGEPLRLPAWSPAWTWQVTLRGKGEERLVPSTERFQPSAQGWESGGQRGKHSQQRSTLRGAGPVVFQKVLASLCASSPGQGWAVGMMGHDTRLLCGARAARPAAPQPHSGCCDPCRLRTEAPSPSCWCSRHRAHSCKLQGPRS